MGGSSPATARSAPRSNRRFSFTLEVKSAVLRPRRLARSNRVSRVKKSADSIYVPSPVAALYQKLPVIPCWRGRLLVITDALFTLVTEGMTQLPLTQNPLAPMRRRVGTSAWSKYCGSPPSMRTINTLRGICCKPPLTESAWLERRLHERRRATHLWRSPPPEFADAGP